MSCDEFNWWIAHHSYYPLRQERTDLRHATSEANRLACAGEKQYVRRHLPPWFIFLTDEQKAEQQKIFAEARAIDEAASLQYRAQLAEEQKRRDDPKPKPLPEKQEEKRKRRRKSS